jgi:hypothetical protein
MRQFIDDGQLVGNTSSTSGGSSSESEVSIDFAPIPGIERIKGHHATMQGWRFFVEFKDRNREDAWVSTGEDMTFDDSCLLNRYLRNNIE